MSIAAVGVMVSCGGGATSSSPGAAAKEYAEAIAEGDYDKFIDGIHFSEGTSADEIAQGKLMLRSMLNEKGAKTLEERGGMKSVEVISEEIAEDGKTAKVNMRYTYGNGETSDEAMDMFLDGKTWKMELNK